jgi:hypothetical protein
MPWQEVVGGREAPDAKVAAAAKVMVTFRPVLVGR